MLPVRKTLVAAALASVVALPVTAHIERSEPLQSMRQSYFALVGMAFGPMGDMVKGKMEWNSEQFAELADDLAGLSGYGVERGFAAGSEMGTTRAKPEIWDNMDDFKMKLAAFREEATKLNAVAASGDEAAMKAQFGAVGKTCKACHDEYKSKDYLY